MINHLPSFNPTPRATFLPAVALVASLLAILPARAHALAIDLPSTGPGTDSPVTIILPASLADVPASPGNAASPSRRDVLEAIHQLENPRNLSTPGPCGELGAYQFRQSVWRMHTREPFVRALNRPTSDRVAVLHYEWLRHELARRGAPVSAYTIALAWNGGVGAVLRRHPPAAAVDYARRAEALAGAIEADAKARRE